MHVGLLRTRVFILSHEDLMTPSSSGVTWSSSEHNSVAYWDATPTERLPGAPFFTVSAREAADVVGVEGSDLCRKGRILTRTY